MFDDIELDALAKQILTKVVSKFESWDVSIFQGLEETEDGELIPTYSATLVDNYGSFRCELLPLATVKKIILESERIYDELAVTLIDTQSGESVEVKVNEGLVENRLVAISTMAELATAHLLSSFRWRLCDLIEDTFQDCCVVAKGALTATILKHFKGQIEGKLIGDARPEIEKAAERSAEKRRALLRKALVGLPPILAERGPGAPSKSPEDREREAKAYAARVEDVYRKLRTELGKTPTKTSVAKELGEGGVNPRKGSDTSLSALGNKLRRLTIDYDSIVKKVEDELNNNS